MVGKYRSAWRFFLHLPILSPVETARLNSPTAKAPSTKSRSMSFFRNMPPPVFHPVDPENAYPAFQRSSRPQRSCSHPLVVVMQSTHVRESDHRALPRRLHRSSVRAVHGQGEMRPPAMVILEVVGEQTPQMALTQHNDLIQTLCVPGPGTIALSPQEMGQPADLTPPTSRRRGPAAQAGP